jgi:predicted GH43/DUF377 family glycosyl hydrolase
MRWRKQGVLFPLLPHNDWAVSHAALPIAEPLDGDRWRVLFSTRDARNRSSVGCFEMDMRTPQRRLSITEHPLLSPGSLGTFDEAGAMGAWSITVGTCTYLYYIGWNVGGTVPFRNAVGLALREHNAPVFSRYSSGPILDRSIYDPCFVASPCVLVENSVWRMWYTSGIAWNRVNGSPQPRYHIKYAESQDGIHWRRDGHVCIDLQDETETAISRPCVVRDRTTYKMWYSYRGVSYRIGYAESTDGMIWTRKDEEVGIDVARAGWDSEMIEYPFIFDHGGQRYMLYNGNGYGRAGIGLARLDSA